MTAESPAGKTLEQGADAQDRLEHDDANYPGAQSHKHWVQHFAEAVSVSWLRGS